MAQMAVSKNRGHLLWTQKTRTFRKRSPTGNLQPFEKLPDDAKAPPKMLMYRLNMVSGRE